MRQLRCVLKAEFPYTKVFILGLILTVLGSACVVVSVVGIVKLAWGYYVGTGMWGGVTITVSGLAAMYSARVQTSMSARLYFILSIVTCIVSFAMLVLSAGGLTYKSNFYQPMKIDLDRHQVTLFLHGSVLGISVLSLACNVLSVIVCCKFMKREKDRSEEGFKLRRHRHRFSDPSAVYRTGSLRGGSGTVRSSTSSRTPLFGSDRSRKHSRQASDSDYSTSLKIPGDRASHRRDSDRSRGSSRSRHSHHRQSSSVSQQSRHSNQMEAEVTTVLLRDPQHSQTNSLSGHRDGVSFRSITDNARDSQADNLTDNVSIQLVFDPDEEPPPPYEEARPATEVSSTGDESDTETVDGSSNVVIPSYLPLNIPVTQIGGPCERQTQSLQRQPPPVSSAQTWQNRAGYNEQSSGVVNRTGSVPNSPDVNSSDERDNRINLMRMTLSGERSGPVSSPTRHSAPRQGVDLSQPNPSEDRSASPEICALTGARMTPVAAVQPDNVAANNMSAPASFVPRLNCSTGSSDTSIPGDATVVPKNPVSFNSQSGTAHLASCQSPSALPAGIRSPNSAFRPVGRRIVPLSQASPSHSVPLHNFFSPISSPGSAHHTVYSPVASPSAVPRFASSPTSPRHTNNLASSSESLSRGGSAQSLLWKKIPLPTSHNHSNRTSSVPTKEVTSKNIPGPAVPPPKEQERDQMAQSQSQSKSQSQSLPRQSSKDMERPVPVPKPRKQDGSSRIQAPPSSGEKKASRDPGSQFATFPVRRLQEAPVSLSARQLAPRHSIDSHTAGVGSRSAFVGCQSNSIGNHPGIIGNRPAGEGNHLTSVGSHPTADGSHPVTAAVGGRHADKNNHSAATSVGSHPPALNSRSKPAEGKTGAVGTHSATVSKQTTAVNLPSAISREQPAQVDSNRRSAGCQATEEDGGLSSSMDRTHRWVLGTLPSSRGARFQGTTRNISHIHSTSSPGTRSSMLGSVNRHGGTGRAHGIWDRPSKTAAPVSMSLPSSSVGSSHPVVVQPFRPVAVADVLSSPQRGSSSSRLPRYQQVNQQPLHQPVPRPAQQPQLPRQHRQINEQQQHTQQLQPVQQQQAQQPVQQQRVQQPVQQQQAQQPVPQQRVQQPVQQQRVQQPVQQQQAQQPVPQQRVQQPVQQQRVQQPVQQQWVQQPVQQQQAQRPVQQQRAQQQPIQQQPVQLWQPARQQQPPPPPRRQQQQLQQQPAQLGAGEAEQDDDQQQGKPLFSLLL